MADGAEQHHVAVFAQRQGLGRQGFARFFQGGAADQRGRKFKFDSALTADQRQHFDRFLNHLRTDAVSGEHCDANLHVNLMFLN